MDERDPQGGPGEACCEHLCAERAHPDATALGLLRAQLLEARETIAQLQQALDSRVAIEQGKGYLAASRGITTSAAFEVIRRHARNNGRPIHDLAAQLVAEGPAVLDADCVADLRPSRRSAHPATSS